VGADVRIKLFNDLDVGTAGWVSRIGFNLALILE